MAMGKPLAGEADGTRDQGVCLIVGLRTYIQGFEMNSH